MFLINFHYFQLITERGFHHGFYNTIKDFINTMDTKTTPIYLLSFNYTGPYTFASIYSGSQTSRHYGAVHCDDLIYLFRSPLLFNDFEKDSRHAKVLQLYVKNLVHFAKYL